MRTAIYEFGSFIQENFTLINGFDEASNNNHNNEKENAPTAQDCTPPTDAAVVVVQTMISEEQAPAPAPAPAIHVPIAAAKTRDVDALVQQLDEHIEQCVTYTTGTALLNESGAVTSCCEQQLHAVVEQATPLLANVSSVADEKRQQQQQQAVDAVQVSEMRRETRGATWLVGLVPFFF